MDYNMKSYKLNGKMQFEARPQKTIKIVLEPTKYQFNVKNDIPKILKIKKNGGVFDEVDPDIIRSFGNVTIEGRNKKITSYICKDFAFSKNGKGKIPFIDVYSSHIRFYGGMEQFIEKNNISIKYNIFDAIMIAKQLTYLESFMESKDRVHIFLQESAKSNMEHKLVIEKSNFTLGKLKVSLESWSTISHSNGW